MRELPPLPNGELTGWLLEKMKEHPDLTVADIEYDPYERKYRLKLEKRDGVQEA